MGNREKAAGRTEAENIYARSVNQSIDYMNAHYPEKITLEDLALQGFFSPYHFHRIFKGMVGETPRDYLNRLRLEKAAILLEGDLSTAQVALATGFSASSHFIQAFKKRFGLSPGAWRRKGGKAAAAPEAPRRGPSEAGEMPYTISEFPPLFIAYVRHVGSYDFSIGLAWRKLMAWARRKGLVTGETIRISCSWDDPALTPDGKLRYDACVSLPESARARRPEPGPVSFRELEGGRYAVFAYEGDISGLSGFYDAVYGSRLPRLALELGRGAGYRIHRESASEQIRGFCRQELRIPLA